MSRDMTPDEKAADLGGWARGRASGYLEGLAVIKAEARRRALDEVVAAVERLPATPYYTGDKEAVMCPNCVTPWRCNGPHVLPHDDPDGYEVDRADVLAVIDRLRSDR